ncbi:MAG TPA: hypothetical protein VMW24_12925, partial [Sedimentisphaerales bacterium]|nr:hypothetical protein [Sedimentisphaerales bacterium]
HEGGASTYEGSPELRARKLLDMDYYVRKWVTGELFHFLNHPTVPATREELEEPITHIRGQIERAEKLLKG